MKTYFKAGSSSIIPGDGRKTGNYVYIGNVVNDHILASEKGRPGERYIPGGENLTFDELSRALDHVTGLPPAITPDFVKKYMNHWSLSSRKAIEELGYEITPFKEGAKRTIEWLGRKGCVRGLLLKFI